MVNFTACGEQYSSNQTLIDRWGYTGPTTFIPPNRTVQITYDGCLAVCGRGNDWYEWKQSSGTITTWILPVIGMLLQAPFQSNAFWDTCFAIARWVGSPMASLAYILWNIKVSGKCAVMGWCLFLGFVLFVIDTLVFALSKSALSSSALGYVLLCVLRT